MKTSAFTMAILLFMSLLAFTASADYTCTGNTSQFTTTINVSSSPVPIAYDEICPFGCNAESGQCNPSSFDNLWLELFLFLAIAVILLYIGRNLNDEDWFLQLLFMIAALVLIVATLGLLLTKEAATNNTLFAGPVNYIYWFAIVILMVIIFYYVIKTILKVLFKVSDIKS